LLQKVAAIDWWALPTLSLLACLVFGDASARAAEADELALPDPFSRLLPLHQRLGPPQPGEWLAEHPEPGQGYRQYTGGRPRVPALVRRVIYVQPLGEFTASQRKILSTTAEYLHVFFDLPVQVQPRLALRQVPKPARRKHPAWGMDQILTGYLLEDVLVPRLPGDAAACLGLTASDLWPGEGWNFVFGQAVLGGRVGVWSMYRYGDPDENEASYRRCLMRTLKVAAHETGHMFGLAHCTAFECNMCGSNHLEEADRRPSWLCPVCMAKLCWATGAHPQRQYERLAAFCGSIGLAAEQEFYQKSLEALRK
jgi:archaemetzincin